MAHEQIAHEHIALTKAFSGFGVDEKTLITVLGKWKSEEKKLFRKNNSDFFHQDHRDFEKWSHAHTELLEQEFARFKKAIVLWTMHPWERDARLIRDSLSKGVQAYYILVEIACTRSSEELLGARKAYHSLFDHSIEEDVAYHVKGIHRNLLVALVSSYRYEGERVNDAMAKEEAKIIADAIKVDENPSLDSEVVRILTTRSKLHLKHVFAHYKELYGKTINEDLVHDFLLRETVLCLSSPNTYFSKVLHLSLGEGVDENIKGGLTRVTITRADIDLKEIAEEYYKLYEVQLADKIELLTHGNFKDFLLSLLARSE